MFIDLPKLATLLLVLGLAAPVTPAFMIPGPCGRPSSPVMCGACVPTGEDEGCCCISERAEGGCPCSVMPAPLDTAPSPSAPSPGLDVSGLFGGIPGTALKTPSIVPRPYPPGRTSLPHPDHGPPRYIQYHVILR